MALKIVADPEFSTQATGSSRPAAPLRIACRWTEVRAPTDRIAPQAALLALGARSSEIRPNADERRRGWSRSSRQPEPIAASPAVE